MSRSFQTGSQKVLVSGWLWVFGPLSSSLSLTIVRPQLHPPSFPPPGCPVSSWFIHLLSPLLPPSAAFPELQTQHPLDPRPRTPQSPPTLRVPQTEPAILITLNCLSLSRFINEPPHFSLCGSSSVDANSPVSRGLTPLVLSPETAPQAVPSVAEVPACSFSSFLLPEPFFYFFFGSFHSCQLSPFPRHLSLAAGLGAVSSGSSQLWFLGLQCSACLCVFA